MLSACEPLALKGVGSPWFRSPTENKSRGLTSFAKLNYLDKKNGGRKEQYRLEWVGLVREEISRIKGSLGTSGR